MGQSRSPGHAVTLTLSSNISGESMYSRSFHVDASNPEKCTEVITQEIACALSEEDSEESSSVVRTLKAEIVPEEPVPLSLRVQKLVSGEDFTESSQPSSSYYTDTASTNFDVQIEPARQDLGWPCGGLSALLCNPFE